MNNNFKDYLGQSILIRKKHVYIGAEEVKVLNISDNERYVQFEHLSGNISWQDINGWKILDTITTNYKEYYGEFSTTLSHNNF